MATAKRVFIVDEIIPRPGKAEEFLRLYMNRYAPGARQRGMQLEHTWVSPPVWLHDRSNTVLIVWSVPDPQHVWAKNFAGRLDESLAAWWWEEAATFVQARNRLVMSDADHVAALIDV